MSKKCLCFSCKEIKSLDAFNKRSKNKNRYGTHSYCKECVKIKNIEWRAKNPERHKELAKKWDTKNIENRRIRKLKNSYKITPEQFGIMLKEQNGLCLICKQPETILNTKTNKIRELCIDHDHSCCSGTKSCGKCIRGLLCQSCNMAIGLLKDSPDIIESALKYIKGK